ncbi:hypothetical protein [Periweissella fabalis]|uniref:Uncharacterized protein n=1 Tax=Periweissella fabalis TaxID=1070421 RepID=A0A7X6N218_9LACO|nr:hypothetical protein [Periweissella fabalis]MCM0599509.1 hypothetical protein [Periweissella fabalis]NKZ23814.1 hypothetical protein [Periweissella fabalis]
MIATLTNLPETLVLENVLANLSDEALTNQDGNMQIIKRFSRKIGKITTSTSILALYHEGKENLYELTQSKLRTLLRELGLDSSSEKRNTTIRSEILQEWKSNGTQIEQELSIATKRLTKSIWEALKKQLPDFQLFKSDRDNSDTDPEVQNPMTVLIKSVLDNTEIHDLLADVQERVISELENSTKGVLDILN